MFNTTEGLMASESTKRTIRSTNEAKRSASLEAWWTKENRARRRRELFATVLVLASVCVGVWVREPLLALWLAVVAVFVKR